MKTKQMVDGRAGNMIVGRGYRKLSIDDISFLDLGVNTYNFKTMEVSEGKNKIVILEDGAWMQIGNGSLVQLDEIDVERVQKHRWWKAGPGYIGTEIDGCNLYLHRFIMNPASGLVVDHLDRDTHNNRRDNLVVKTQQKNAWNRVASSNTGYLGVSEVYTTKKYLATLTYDNRVVLNKTYTYLTDARIARLVAELHYRGSHIPGLIEELNYLTDNREALVEQEKRDKSGDSTLYVL